MEALPSRPSRTGWGVFALPLWPRAHAHRTVRRAHHRTCHVRTCREWPFEDLVPGLPKNEPPYNGMRQKGHKREAAREERQQRIAEAMAKMPQLIADYRVSGDTAGGGADSACGGKGRAQRDAGSNRAARGLGGNPTTSPASNPPPTPTSQPRQPCFQKQTPNNRRRAASRGTRSRPSTACC